MNSNNEKTRHQKFEIQRIDRAQITEAPYNPRVIGENERKKLKAAIKELGLVETLVWNRRTGHLVGGHQRLSIIDDLEGGKPYSMDMSVIDVDLKQEKRLNVILNNPGVQGEWDIEALETIIREVDMDYSGLGFDPVDIQLMCSAPDISTLFDKEPATSTIEQIEVMKAKKKALKAEGKVSDSAEFYFSLVFKDRADTEAFLKACGQPTDSRFISGPAIAEKFGIKFPSETPVDK